VHGATELNGHCSIWPKARCELQAVFRTCSDLRGGGNKLTNSERGCSSCGGKGCSSSSNRRQAPAPLGRSSAELSLFGQLNAQNNRQAKEEQAKAELGLKIYKVRSNFLEGLNCPSTHSNSAKSPRVPRAGALGERAQQSKALLKCGQPRRAGSGYTRPQPSTALARGHKQQHIAPGCRPGRSAGTQATRHTKVCRIGRLPAQEREGWPCRAPRLSAPAAPSSCPRPRPAAGKERESSKSSMTNLPGGS
jgi:hypothetical protein